MDCDYINGPQLSLNNSPANVITSILLIFGNILEPFEQYLGMKGLWGVFCVKCLRLKL